MTLQPAPTDGETQWFVHDRFGMFIHWGLYALPARHEWVKSMERIDTETYQKYFKHFDPDLYDPTLWANAAASAGMKYFVVTTKHHEGFCLWDTQLNDYKATNTPYGKDLLKPMVEAFRGQGLKVGFYHSLLDWHHPHYTVDQHHPMRDNPDYIAQDKDRDINQYVEYLFGQTRELLTQFGKVDILWYDFSVGPSDRFAGKGKDVWQSEKLIRLVRELQPGIILNDRLEIDQDEESWKSVDLLVKMLIDSVSKGGNLLLNVGPTGRGEFDARALDRLAGMGEWMKRHSRAIYGCTQAPEAFACPEDCRYTYNPQTNRLYLHVFSWPFRHLHLDGMGERVEYAQLLNDASEIKMLKRVPEASYGAMQESREASLLTLELPVKKPNVTVPVIELFLK